jgi:hypothetical protein
MSVLNQHQLHDNLNDIDQAINAGDIAGAHVLIKRTFKEFQSYFENHTIEMLPLTVRLSMVYEKSGDLEAASKVIDEASPSGHPLLVKRRKEIIQARLDGKLYWDMQGVLYNEHQEILLDVRSSGKPHRLIGALVNGPKTRDELFEAINGQPLKRGDFSENICRNDLYTIIARLNKKLEGFIVRDDMTYKLHRLPQVVAHCNA